MRRNLSRVLKQRLPALKKFFARDPRVLGVWLFGSQADGTATPRSDIDLAVLFERDLTLDEELTFQVAVCDTLGAYDKVDIVDLNRASLLLQRRTIAGELIYERDYARVSDFVERILIEYPDYAQFLDRFNADFLEGVRQDYGRFRYSKNHRAQKDHRKQPAAVGSEAR